MSMREKDDGYSKVVAILNPDYRVIECRDGIQWIIQKRFPASGRTGNSIGHAKH